MRAGKSADKNPRVAAIDWPALRRRMDDARRAIEQSMVPDPERRREILLQRARRVAVAPQPAVRAGEFEILEFSLAHELYGIELRYVREVVPLRRYTPVPGAPPFVIGIINLHGEILSVVDLKRFFDLPDAGLTDLNKVIVLRHDGMEFGVLADALTGIKVLTEAEVQAPLPHLTGVRAEFSRGIAPGSLVVLDVARMLADKTLTLSNGERARTHGQYQNTNE